MNAITFRTGFSNPKRISLSLIHFQLQQLYIKFRKTRFSKICFLIVLLISAIIFSSCSREEIQSVPEEEIENLPPTSFNLHINNITDNSATLEWENSSDPEGQEVTYSIYLNNIFYAESSTNSIDLQDLQETTAYGIKVIAQDPQKNERVEKTTFSTLKYYHTFKIPLWYEPEDMPINFQNEYIETSDDHLIFVGSFMDKEVQSLAHQELVIFKINFDGEIIWKKVVPSLIIDMFPFNKIREAEDGGFIVLTVSSIIKFTGDGNVEWIKEIEDGSRFYEYRDIVFVPGQGYLAVGNRTRDASQVILLKLDSQGNTEWHKFYGESLYQQATSIVSNGNNTFTFFGNKENSGIDPEEMNPTHPEYNPDFWLVTVDSEGELLWENTYGGLHEDEIIMSQLIKTRDNGFAFVGLTHRGANRYRSIYRISKDGELLWYNTNGNGTDLINSVTEAHDGGFYTAGQYDIGATNQWLQIQKFTADGNLEYERKYYDFSFLTYGGWIKELSNEQLIMPFARRNFYRDLLPENIFIVKTRPRGEFDGWR